MPEITPSQTVGPFFKIGMLRENQETAAGPDVPGTHVRIEGAVYDGDGVPVPDAVIEIWQPDADGKFAAPNEKRNTSFTGFARSGTDKKGMYRVNTIKPGALPWPKTGKQAPHIAITVHSRGLLARLHTRLYFEDEAANANDPVLALVEPARRATLIAKKNGADKGATLYRFDVHLQGDNETVFFEV